MLTSTNADKIIDSVVSIEGQEEKIQSKLDCLQQFSSARIFSQPDSFLCDSPFLRPIRNQDISNKLLQGSVTKDTLSDPDHLLAQRILLNIYEQDLMFLPRKQNSLNLGDFNEFYDPILAAKGRSIRPDLEFYCFDWLEKNIHINSRWNIDSFTYYTQEVIKDIASSDSSLYHKVTESRDPISAAKFYLIQCAGDFLSEASAMGRNVLGNFGAHTSELFKIFIDEYGYGVNEKKHSTIFEELMRQAGMSHDIHHYWQFYTSTSIALINYFHYVSANHGAFFKYIGAMYFTEATLAFTTKSQSKMIKKVFDGTVSTQYFDEHSHIDVHHGRMALDKLIVPLVKQYGDQILVDMLAGFEEFKLLQDAADDELFAHIDWHDRLNEYKHMAREIRHLKKPDMFFEEEINELSVTHTHPVDELFWVENGQVELIVSPIKSVVLNEGEGIVIPKGMLHGSLVLSPSSKYSVTAITCENL